MSKRLVAIFLTVLAVQCTCQVPRINWNSRVGSRKSSLVLVYDSSERLTRNINEMWQMTRLLHENTISSIANTWGGYYHDYIFVPFFDEPNGVFINPEIKTNLTEIAHQEYLLEETTEVSEDCSKSIFTAIYRAVELARTGSLIFVTVDGEPKDDDEKESLKTLIRQKRAVVHIYLTNRCAVDSDVVDVYRDIATTSGGIFERGQYSDVGRILRKYQQALTKRVAARRFN